jgi:hypothetical protein
VTSRTAIPACCVKAQEARALAAGRLHSDALQISEGTHPGEHLPIALAGRGEGLRSDDPIPLIHGRFEVEILMRIDAADDATLLFFQ